MSEESKVNISLSADENNVSTLLQGKAPEEKPKFRKGIKVNGTLTVPTNHLLKPSNWLNTANELGDAPLQFSFVEVDREEGTIKFVEDAGYPWENSYIGKLEVDERFKKFKINTGESYTTLQLAEFIKMNRGSFESKSEAMKLVSILIDFEADVDNKIKASNDGRGNTTALRHQVVKSNIPEIFRINVPIFKGYDKQLIEVEIGINASDLSCTLISPEANDYVEAVKDELIDEQVTRIEEAHPDLRIFEI